MFPGYKPIIDVGLKYNYHNVLYLIATEDEEATQDGITYLYTYAVSDYISQSIFFSPLFFLVLKNKALFLTSTFY